jgi:hypothetical protein
MNPFEGCQPHAIESWVNDPMTEVFLRGLARHHQLLLESLESRAMSGDGSGALNGIGGRCGMLREIIRTVRDATKEKAE